MIRWILTLYILLLSITAQAQKTIKGVVKEKETAQPVAGASVFLNNTSIGTATNAAGVFELNMPPGKFDLIVSSIGYETYTTTITTETPDLPTILLLPKAKELETVIIEPVEKNGWEKWGKFFIENFIGTSDFAKQCTIKNYKTLRFRNSKKAGTLTAFASEPLIIENKALGFTIQYQLEEFKFDFNTKYLTYLGYPFFKPMKGSNGRQKKWSSNQFSVFEGSIMHFMRSIYRNTLIKEGFEIRHLQKQPNLEKARVKKIFRRAETEGDSTVYYNKVLRQPDFFNIVGKAVLPGDSVAYAIDNLTAGLEFNDYLLVLYKNKVTPPEYRRYHPDNSAAMLSEIILINGQPVEIQANGSYYQPLDLLSLGYWSWSEKIATMLPFDYSPKE